MGDFADDVQELLREELTARTDRDWVTEYSIRRTPVDVAGLRPAASPDSSLLLVELEWRRADPSNNPVKLARYASEGDFTAPVVLVQLFSNYYDLTAGGVSSKRKNAEFVGDLATDVLDDFTYHGLDLDVDPPKRGGDRPAGWRDVVADAATEITDLVE